VKKLHEIFRDSVLDELVVVELAELTSVKLFFSSEGILVGESEFGVGAFFSSSLNNSWYWGFFLG
jgi:hypothetical protein